MMQRRNSCLESYK